MQMYYFHGALGQTAVTWIIGLALVALVLGCIYWYAPEYWTKIKRLKHRQPREKSTTDGKYK